MPKHNKLLGAQGEEKSSQFLQELGYTIVERNWRTRYGEIDIIATKNKTLYLIEVKTRSTLRFGSPIEAITSRKLQRMHFTAHLYANHIGFRGPMHLLIVEVLNNHCTIHEL